jgi:hypothetical protein
MKKHILLLLLPLLLASCNGEGTSSNASSTSSKEPSQAIVVDRYVSDVASTAPFMVAGMDGDKKVDYVISSHPVIFSAMSNENKKTNLSIYASVAEKFSQKYATEGFPQAGLFIKTELYNQYVSHDESTVTKVNSFLGSFDAACKDLASGGTQAVAALNSYSSNVEEQKTRFGFASGVIKNVQKDNGLAFLEHEKNPDVAGLEKFSAPLSISIQESDLATSLYDPTKKFDTKAESLEFKVTCPKGAPAAAFASFAASEDLNLTTPDNVKGAFSTKNSDFIVFDSVNGVKLSKANQNAYKLVRMVTFGNLYIVSTGNDEDNTLSNDDYIVSYGENLVPDLAFKAVYGA